MSKEYLLPLVGTPRDYSRNDNWMVLEKDGKFEVDTIFFYATTFQTPDCEGNIVSINDEMKSAAKKLFKKSGVIFDSFTNIYAPYYRQLSGKVTSEFSSVTQAMDIYYQSIVRTDAFAALDTYFEKYNNGKPFILLGHGQGAAIIRMILEDYMKVHPDFLKNMIAAYAPGFAFDGKFYSKNYHVLPAAEEIDTGVVISWNTEAKGAINNNLSINAPNCQIINPINWKTDNTYASVDENKGSLVFDETTGEYKVVKGIADAHIGHSRHAIICTTADELCVDSPIYGDRSLHDQDLMLYWENVRENARKRIDAYCGSSEGRLNKLDQLKSDPEALKKHKPLAIIASIILVVLGLLLFLDPISTSAWLVWIIIVGVLIGGVEMIITYFQKPKGARNGNTIAIGIVRVLAALLLLIGAVDNSALATANISWAVGILAGCSLLFSGIDNISKSGKVKENGGSSTSSVICGILELICAALVISAPIFGFVALNVVFGAYLIVNGITLLIRALSVK